MKKIFIVLFVLLAFIINGLEKIGEAIIVDGDVKVTRSEKTINVAPGDEFFDMDIIATGKKSKLEINLINKNGSLIVKEDTQINLSSYIKDDSKKFNLSLPFGNIKNILNTKSGNDEFYTVTTPTITLGVRGTEFEVITTDIGDTYIEVSDGEVIAGDNNEKGEIDKKGFKQRLNEMIIKKGDRAQRLINEEKIKRGDISREEWIKRRRDFLKDNPDKAMLKLQNKAIRIGEKIIEINRVLHIMKKERDDLRSKIENARKKLKNLRIKPGQKIDVMKNKILNPFKKEIDELRIKHFAIIKTSRIILDDYWSTKEMLKKFRRKIREGEIVIKDKEAFRIFNQNIDNLKKAEENAQLLERIWRDSIERINKDRQIVN